MPVFVEGRRFPRATWWVTLALALVVAIAGTGIAYGTHAYATEHDGRILPGVAVAGVDLGGMTAEEAAAAVEEAVAPELDRVLTLRWQGRSWTTTPRALGTTTDADALAADLVDVSETATLASLARMRWFGDSLALEREVTLTHDPQGARAFVDEIARELHVPARDAGLNVTGDSFEIVPEAAGQAVDTEAAAAALVDALRTGGDRVDLAVHPVEATTTTADFRQVLLLRQGAHTLDLYQDGQLVRTWNVAVGTSGYRTPTGIYEVTLKRHMPTWVNPSPNGWGRGMPARIGPGVNNPLGVRALNWNAPAIRFHGTANVNSIGRDASKGCVRLTNDDVVELYDLVDVGATIVSLR